MGSSKKIDVVRKLLFNRFRVFVIEKFGCNNETREISHLTSIKSANVFIYISVSMISITNFQPTSESLYIKSLLFTCIYIGSSSCVSCCIVPFGMDGCKLSVSQYFLFKLLIVQLSTNKLTTECDATLMLVCCCTYWSAPPHFLHPV